MEHEPKIGNVLVRNVWKQQDKPDLNKRKQR